MELTYSAHARDQITRRGISDATIRAVIVNPEKEVWDGRRSARYLFGYCVVVIPMYDGAHVITAYDTDAQEPERTYKEGSGTKNELRKRRWFLRRRPGMAPKSRRRLQRLKNGTQEEPIRGRMRPDTEAT